MAARDSSALKDQAERELEGLDDQAGADVAQGMNALGGHFAMQGSVMQIPASLLQDAGNEETEDGPEASRRDQSHDARRSQTADVTLAAYSAGVARYQDFSITIGGEEMDAEEFESEVTDILNNWDEHKDTLESQGYTDEEIQDIRDELERAQDMLADGHLTEQEKDFIDALKPELQDILEPDSSNYSADKDITAENDKVTDNTNSIAHNTSPERPEIDNYDDVVNGHSFTSAPSCTHDFKCAVNNEDTKPQHDITREATPDKVAENTAKEPATSANDLNFA